MSRLNPMVDKMIRDAPVQFTAQDRAEVVRLAQAAAAGVSKPKKKSDPLNPLYNTLEKGCSIDELATQLRLLASNADLTYGSLANKYKAVVYYLERTTPVPGHLLISVKPTKASAAVIFHQSASGPTATAVWKEFTNSQKEKKLRADDQGTFQQAVPTSVDGLDMTIEDYLLKNRATTRLYLIHVGGNPDGIQQIYDGRSCMEHINSVLELGQKLRMNLGILQNPSVNTEKRLPAAEAVCTGLQFQVGKYDAERVKVVNGGTGHSGFGDLAFQSWVDDASVKTIVVMGFDADICVHANVFGSKQYVKESVPVGTATPPQLLPSLLGQKDIVTSRPMLIGTGVIRRHEWGPLYNI